MFGLYTKRKIRKLLARDTMMMLSAILFRRENKMGEHDLHMILMELDDLDQAIFFGRMKYSENNDWTSKREKAYFKLSDKRKATMKEYVLQSIKNRAEAERIYTEAYKKCPAGQ